MRVIDYFVVVALSFHIAYSCLVSLIKDSILSKVVESDSKVNFLWQKKSRIGLVVGSYMESDEYLNLVKHLNDLIYSTDNNLKPSKGGIGSKFNCCSDTGRIQPVSSDAIRSERG